MATGRWRWIWVIGLLPGNAVAEEVTPLNPHPELMRTYYDYGVVEYCGLVNMPVHNGYALLRNDQLARGKGYGEEVVPARGRSPGPDRRHYRGRIRVSGSWSVGAEGLVWDRGGGGGGTLYGLFPNPPSAVSFHSYFA